MDQIPVPRNLVFNQIRRRKKLRDNIMGITRPAIRKLARRGGIIRIKSDIYDEARRAIRDRLTEILRQVALILESSDVHSRQRKVVTIRDVIYALARLGNTLYGF
ncbi:hypothetical protein RU639_006753 [Aspergillus parasiticus]